MGLQRVGHDLVTERQEQHPSNVSTKQTFCRTYSGILSPVLRVVWMSFDPRSCLSHKRGELEVPAIIP